MTVGKITFKELARLILKEAKKPLTPREIWEWAQKKGYDKLLGSKGKTPWDTISAQLYMDIREDPNTPFIKVDTHPVRFSLKELEGQLREEGKGQHYSYSLGYSERDLHPFLTYYARLYMKVYTKTIFHEHSRKKKYAQWLHPDMVGISLPSWNKPIGDDLIKLTKMLGGYEVSFYSFEIKRYLDFSNLRESFFQAVSNSSWANEGYLVVADISDDPEFMEELRRLSNSFNIGIIKLNLDNPDSSKTLFQAKRKQNVDWDTVNKLYTENKDFREFIKRVYKDVQTNEIRSEKYDKLEDLDTLLNRIKKKIKSNTSTHRL